MTLALGLATPSMRGHLQRDVPPAWVMRGASLDIDLVNRLAFRSNQRSVQERFVEATLDDLLTLTRASEASRFQADGDLKTMASDTFRFDHDPVTLAAKGLLLETTRINVVLHNRDLTNAAWTKTNVTAAKDQTGLDGVGNSASSITATADNGTCLQAITLTSAGRFQTAYVKRLAGTGAAQMTMDGGATWTTVTVTASWARVSIPAQTLANPSVGFRLATSGDSIAVDYVQNEVGTAASSAIAVTTTAATRAVDVLTFAIGSWFNPSAGTFVLEWSKPQSDTNYLLSLHNGSTSEMLSLARPDASGSDVYFRVIDGGVAQTSFGVSSTPTDTVHKIAFAYAANDFAASFAGATAGTDTAGTLPSGLTEGRLASGPASAGPMNMHARRLTYFPQRRSNAQLQALAA